MPTTAKREIIFFASIHKPKLGEYLPGTQYKCVSLIGERKWWEFWKPRAIAGIYRYMGED